MCMSRTVSPCALCLQTVKKCSLSVMHVKTLFSEAARGAVFFNSFVMMLIMCLFCREEKSDSLHTRRRPFDIVTLLWRKPWRLWFRVGFCFCFLSSLKESLIGNGGKIHFWKVRQRYLIKLEKKNSQEHSQKPCESPPSPSPSLVLPPLFSSSLSPPTFVLRYWDHGVGGGDEEERWEGGRGEGAGG